MLDGANLLPMLLRIFGIAFALLQGAPEAFNFECALLQHGAGGSNQDAIGEPASEPRVTRDMTSRLSRDAAQRVSRERMRREEVNGAESRSLMTYKLS